MVDDCKSFLFNREWDKVKSVWEQCLRDPSNISDAIRGDDQYGFSRLSDISYEGSVYSQSDRRKTFAIQIGYLGWHYRGFQMQKGVLDVYTVQDDLLEILQRPVVAAGRTDKEVSALSQIVSFHTFDEIEAEDIEALFSQSQASKESRLRLIHCTRVPRKFHALFSATWRRYLYLLPLGEGDYDGFDVDVDFMRSLLCRYLYLIIL